MKIKQLDSESLPCLKSTAVQRHSHLWTQEYLTPVSFSIHISQVTPQSTFHYNEIVFLNWSNAGFF